MMGVDEVGVGQGARQAGGQRMGRMAAEVGERRQGPDLEARRVADLVRAAPESDQLAVGLSSQRASQLERVALAAAEQSGRAKWRRSYVNDPHASGRLADPGGSGSPERGVSLPPQDGRGGP